MDLEVDFELVFDVDFEMDLEVDFELVFDVDFEMDLEVDFELVFDVDFFSIIFIFFNGSFLVIILIHLPVILSLIFPFLHFAIHIFNTGCLSSFSLHLLIHLPVFGFIS